MPQVSFAGINVDNLTIAEAVTAVEGFIASGKPHKIFTPNPEMIVAAQDDPELKEIINSADLKVADGISMVVVSRLLRNPLKERVTGIDLMLKLCQKSSKTGWRIFLLGSAPGVADEAVAKLRDKFHKINIVGAQYGYEKDEQVMIEKVKQARPDLLFVGLGHGRQERWINRHLKELNVPVVMAIGGSLDVISGRKRRAPKWIQALYIEWLYRLITEPKRWQRQLALPKFLYLTLFRKVI